MLNPLYIDYYDMYFIPDDQCVLNESNKIISIEKGV